MTPAPVPALATVPYRLRDGEDIRGQGFIFYFRDWLNTAFGEGTALLIALVAAIVAAASLSISYLQTCRGTTRASRATGVHTSPAQRYPPADFDGAGGSGWAAERRPPVPSIEVTRCQR